MEVSGEVWVCAPDGERSAISHGLTMGSPIRAALVELPGLSVDAWAVSGTPADCVKLALDELLPCRPDIVMAGVNRGPNLGTDIVYSGTVAAAAEGAFAGIPSIAVSTASYDPIEFANAATAGAMLAAFTVKHGIPRGVMLNVNVPDYWDGKAIEPTRMGVLQYSNIFDKRTDPRGRTYYWLCGDPVKPDLEAGLDTEAVSRGSVSVTPIRFELTDESTLDALRKWDICT